jgi:hypothetical protein
MLNSDGPTMAKLIGDFHGLRSARQLHSDGKFLVHQLWIGGDASSAEYATALTRIRVVGALGLRTAINVGAAWSSTR